MALKSISLLKDSLSSTVDEDYIRSSSRSYQALFDVTDDENYVRTHCTLAGGTLGPYYPHPSDPAQICTNLTVEADSDITTYPADNTPARRWKATVTFGLWNPLEHSIDGNPCHIPDRYSISGTNESVIVIRDVNGNPIVNAAGDPFDPPPEKERYRGSLTVRRNVPVAGNDPVFFANLSNTVNRAPWPANAPTPFPSRTVRIAPITIPEKQFSQVTGAYYWPMEFRFDINPDTWTKEVLNAGFRQLDASGNLVNIYVGGQLATTPVPLSEAGKALLKPTFEDTSDTPPTDADPEAGGGMPPPGGMGDTSGDGVNFIAVDVYELQDFGVLGFDDLFS